MKIHFIQHEVFEAPGAYLEWAKSRNYTISFSKIYEYNALPQTVENIDLLIVMGGPQDPATTQEQCPYFNAKEEIALIQKCIRSQKAVVGICLGAQLIGEALGVKFEHSPEKELGVFPIQLTEVGLQDDKIAHFGASLSVGHWHKDMPGLTVDSKILATSAGCPRQIVSYSNLVYGLQCHMELMPDIVERLLIAEKDFLARNSASKFVQKPDEIRSFDYTEMNMKLSRFLDHLIAEYKTQKSNN